jgi:hypothetical protein
MRVGSQARIGIDSIVGAPATELRLNSHQANREEGS